MDFKTILLIALLLFGFYWYNNPMEGKEKIDQGIDKVQSLLGQAKSTNCPTNYDPVCAEGKEYDNSCFAQKAGYNNMTAGVCP